LLCLLDNEADLGEQATQLPVGERGGKDTEIHGKR
jgi:hypothetical protein